MKRIAFYWVLFVISSALLLSYSQSVFAISETYAFADAGGQGTDDLHSAYPPAVPDSSTATIDTATGHAQAKAFNTGELGASATTSNDTIAAAGGHITDTFYLNLPQAVPGADGIAFYLQLHGSLGANPSETYPFANATVTMMVSETMPILGPLAGACLPAFSTCWFVMGTHNQILDPQNSPVYSIINTRELFSAPLVLIAKGLSPAALANGKELRFEIISYIEGGPGYSNFFNTLTFDKGNPISLYSSSTDNIIPLPAGSTYSSGSGLGVPQTPVVVGPDITVDPAEIDFHDLLLGNVSDQTITVKNEGTAILTLGTIGDPSAPFSRVGGDCANGQAIAPNDSCSIVVRFAPVGHGLFVSSVSIESDDPDDKNVAVTLRGTGIGPEITVDPTHVDFGRVLIAASLNGTITVGNDGNAPLTISGISLPAAPFSLTDGTCTTPKTVAPTESCTIVVRFSPTAQGTASSSFNITSDDPAKGTVSVDLSGKGVLLLVNPEEGTIGTEVTLTAGTGTDFDSKGKVVIGTSTLKITSWDKTTIKATITKASGMDTTTPSDVTVYTKTKGTGPFTVKSAFLLKKPYVTAVSPPSGKSGAAVKIIGHYFSTTKGKVTLQLGTGKMKSCKVTKWAMEEIDFVVPAKLTASKGYTVTVSNKIGDDHTQTFEVTK